MNLKLTLQKQFQDFELDVALDLAEGITVLFGPSGSGKTTLINTVAGLVTPEAGRIELGARLLFDRGTGVNLAPHRRRLGYIFQDARLFPHLSVRQNLNYGRKLSRQKESQSAFDAVVALLGVEPLLERAPAKLSGGEKQRVALGRAVLSGPDMLLADEPLAALDGARKAELLPYFEQLRDELKLPMLYVTHSVSEAARLASRVVVMDKGRVVRVGGAADVLADPSLVPGGVRGVGALLEARITAHHEDGLSELSAGGGALFLPKLAQPVGAQIRVRIAAQDVILSRHRPEGLSALNILQGKITRIRTGEGPGAIVTLLAAGGEVHARITRRSLAALELEVGQSCYAIVKTVSIAREDAGG